MNYIDLTINNSHFIQRTPNSKIIEYDKYNNTKYKYDNIDEMPSYLHNIFYCIKDMQNNPQNYFDYCLTETGTGIVIRDIINSKIPSHIKIPDYIDDIPVRELADEIISESDFYDKIKQVQLPKYLNSLPSFQGTSLETIIIPEKIEIIPVYCFDGCEKLKNVTFPYELDEIAYGAFAECESLTEFIAPNNLTLIRDFAFYNTGLKNVVLNKKLEYIDNSAFKHCSLNKITMYEKTKYHPWAFEYQDKLKIKTISEEKQEERFVR